MISKYFLNFIQIILKEKFGIKLISSFFEFNVLNYFGIQLFCYISGFHSQQLDYLFMLQNTTYFKIILIQSDAIPNFSNFYSSAHHSVSVKKRKMQFLQLN